MAREVRGFTLTVPANTQVSTPVTLNMTMPARVVRHIRCRIPPGPSGLMGFRLSSAGVPIIPYNAGQWITGDNETIELPLEDQISSGAWQAQGYNTGVYQHIVLFTFYLDLVTRGGLLATTAPLDLSA